MGGPILVADVAASGAEFFHYCKDNRWEERGLFRLFRTTMIEKTDNFSSFP